MARSVTPVMNWARTEAVKKRIRTSAARYSFNPLFKHGLTRRSTFWGRVLFREKQLWVGEVETIHDLVVIVAWRFGAGAGKRLRVGALEINDAAALLVEEWVMDRIIEIVLAVDGD